MTIFAYLPAEDASNTYGSVPSELTLTPRRHKSSARFGYTSAQIDVTGPEHAIWSVLEWLRRPVVLVNDQGVEVWAGYVSEAEVNIGNLRVGVSLDEMWNRISIAYMQRVPTGYERRTTEPVNDTASQYRYGLKETIITIGESTEDRATAKALELLAASAIPPKLPSFGGGGGTDLTASLWCVGWAEMLTWRKYALAGWTISFLGAPQSTQLIGWQLSSNDLVFSRKTGLVDYYARLGGLQVGSTIAITGSGTANDRTYVINGAQSGERIAYTANTIYFSPSDDIYDSANGLGFITLWATIRITGSNNNDGTYEIDGLQSTNYVTVTGSAIVSENAGNFITIEQGASLSLSPAPAYYYSTAATKTVTLYGYRLAQSFMPTVTITARQVNIMAGVVGEPTDYLRVALHADGGGAPGTMIGSSILGADDLPAEPDWIYFDFSPLVTLTAGTTYWIVVERTGTLSPTDYFSVRTSGTASGSCLAWTGSAWITNPTGEFLPHIVRGVQETTEQIRAMAASASDIIATTTIINSSGIFDNPDRDGDLSIYDEMAKLLESGEASGLKLLANIDSDRNLTVFLAPSMPGESELPLYTQRGTITIAGQPTSEGALYAGQWLALERVPRHLNISPIFVNEMEYNATTGTYTVVPERLSL